MQSLTFKNELSQYTWFIFVNLFIASLISIRYFIFLPEWPSGIVAPLFIISATISQMATLALIIGIILSPLLLLKKITLKQSLFACVASVGIAVLAVDTFVFAQYRFHINKVVVDILIAEGGGAFSFTSWLIVILSSFALFFAQLFLLRYLRAHLVFQKGGGIKRILQFILICFVFTQVTHIWSAANAYTPVTVTKKYLPLFYPFTSNSLMEKYGWIDREALAQQRALKQNHKSDLAYPLSPLEKISVSKPVNIMIITIDSWRADTFNSDNMPNIWEVAKKQDAFIRQQHFSTGNATRTGIFGLFYGLPGTYWHSILASQVSPVFVDRLQELDYSMGIFTSAPLNKPEFDQTVFRNIKNLRSGSEGASPAMRDIDLQKDWETWYDSQSSSTAKFSFLFYDAPHGYSFPENYEHQYLPMLKEVNYLALNNDTDTAPFFNRYKTSVRFVDGLIKKVMDKLEKSGDIDNTLVIITGDHGQEINDNKLNFWGHNSNFTAAQTHVPFIMFGPGISKNKKQFNKTTMTSHVDIVPTIMKNYLGIESNATQYSTGIDLLGEETDRSWIIAASYSGYGVLTKETITEIDALGNYRLLDKSNRPIKDGQVNFKNLQGVLKQLSRFNK